MILTQKLLSFQFILMGNKDLILDLKKAYIFYKSFKN